MGPILDAVKRSSERTVDIDLDRLATKDMTPEELAQHKLAALNRKASKIVEFGAFDLEDAGANDYAAGVRMVAFTALGLLADLKQPELAGDLTKVQAYCAELLDDLKEPHAA